MPSPRCAALPRRFRRPSVLIVGCGDVGLRVAALLRSKLRLHALTSSPVRQAELRAAGVQPVLGNLDQPASLRRLAALGTRVLHLAPPPSQGCADPRTRNLLQTLARSGQASRLVYGSTTGVYGDCQGEWLDETRPVAPHTERAKRRVDAERQLRACGQRRRTQVTLLRIPGIYAADREGGPRQRLLRGTPVLQQADDVYTNHIHADDLARACVLALWRGRPQRVVNVCDDTVLKMGDYFDAAAACYGLPPPRRITRAEAQVELSAVALSFLSESRRLRNQRLKQELRLRLRHPTLASSLMGQQTQ